MSRTESQRRRTSGVALHATLIVFGTLSLVPLLWMLSASFMAAGEASSFPPALVPHHPTLEHYRDLFGRLALGRYALNSALIARLEPAEVASEVPALSSSLRSMSAERPLRLSVTVPVCVGTNL